MREVIARSVEWVQQEVRDVQVLSAFGTVPGVSVTLDKRVPNALSLHYNPDEHLPDTVRWKQFNDALFRLETVLEKYGHITHVYATSWIAYKNSKFFERYGFTVTKPESDEKGGYNFQKDPYRTLHKIYQENAKKFGIRDEHKDIPPAVAEYSREKFLDQEAPWRRWANRAKK